MADKKKNPSRSPTRSQSQMTEPKARSEVKEQDGKAAAKTVTVPERNSRKAQESKTVKRDSKSPSPLFIRLRSNRLVRFVFDSYYELRHKVTWPSFNEARNMTIAVILISAAIGLILGAIDLGLYQLFLLISKLK
jgi:preprotein translocase subunit SecE